MIFYHLAPSPAGRRAGPDPDNPADDGGEMVRQGIELQVNAFVEGGLHLEFVLTNHTLADVPVELSWELGADLTSTMRRGCGSRGPVPVSAIATDSFGI